MAVVPPPGCEHCSRSQIKELGSVARAVNQTYLTKSELDTTLLVLNIRADDTAQAENIQTVLWTLVVLSAVFLGLRIYCKISYTYTKIRIEDILLVASWLVLASDAALNEFIIKSRFGRPDFPITVDNITVLAIVGLSSITCSFVGQVWSKTAFAISLLRMCDGWKKAFVWFSIISMNVLFAFSSLSFWIGCVPLEKRWKPFADGTCYDLKWVVSFGIFVSGKTASNLLTPGFLSYAKLLLVYSGLLDIALSIIPWLILMRPRPAEESSGLTLSKKEKIGVSVALSMGVLAGMAAFVKASYMRSVNDTTGDFSHGGAELAVWAGAETAITIMASTIPVLRVLLRDTAIKTKYLPEAIKMRVRSTVRRSERASGRPVAQPEEDKIPIVSSGASMSTAGASSTSSGSTVDSQKTLISKNPDIRKK
ncbi:hypothetical protein BDP55DRAFT_636058 [Colletotrichum godetiae]|uniref:Rhodopsin domain-containing protein n=1 Tax=Colletotrichum godetiae TaxID=1209918 RepID=A0AAJ0ACE2_9PEZI|nr:uncharacterized protein BDP55DRAFT_636058 [Colletotrichum godetiae]KAK1671217.1 hypothetical protein BDP55DRAFT_636058 [Colletotrichum godetiae]